MRWIEGLGFGIGAHDKAVRTLHGFIAPDKFPKMSGNKKTLPDLQGYRGSVGTKLVATCGAVQGKSTPAMNLATMRTKNDVESAVFAHFSVSFRQAPIACEHFRIGDGIQ